MVFPRGADGLHLEHEVDAQGHHRGSQRSPSRFPALERHSENTCNLKHTLCSILNLALIVVGTSCGSPQESPTTSRLCSRTFLLCFQLIFQFYIFGNIQLKCFSNFVLAFASKSKNIILSLALIEAGTSCPSIEWSNKSTPR